MRDPRTGRILAAMIARSTARRSSSPRTRRRVGAGDGRRAARGRRAGARADLGDRARRGRRPCTRAATPACCSRAATAARRWELNRTLWEHPTRPDWQPGGGGLCLHSIAPWPGEPDKLALAISAVGVWLTDDGGETWRHGNKGIRAALPARRRARGHDRRSASTTSQRAPKRPERMFIQFHGGVYRSDDAGRAWTDDRRRAAVGLRLPARRRPRRPRQRLRDPAQGRHGPRHARGPRARLRDPRRGRDAGRRAATACRPSTPT